MSTQGINDIDKDETEIVNLLVPEKKPAHVGDIIESDKAITSKNAFSTRGSLKL